MVTPATMYRRMPATRQRSRKILVLAAFAGYPLQIAGYSALVASGGMPMVLWGPLTVALFSATLIGVIGIYGYGQGRMGRRDRLDERERTMADRAMILSYAVLTTFIVAVAGIVAIHLSFIGPITLEMSGMTPWFVAIGLYVPFLPFAALAWIEPDVPDDDEA